MNPPAHNSETGRVGDKAGARPDGPGSQASPEAGKPSSPSGFDPSRLRASANAVRDSQEIIDDGRVSVDLTALSNLLLAAHDWADLIEVTRCSLCRGSGWREVNGYGSVPWLEMCDHGHAEEPA